MMSDEGENNIAIYQDFKNELTDYKNLVETDNVLLTLKSLSTIANILTIEQVTDDLLPIIKNILQEIFNEQVHYEIAIQLGFFVETLSNLTDYVELFNIFSLLMTSDDQLVRDMTIETLTKLIDLLDVHKVNDTFFHFLTNELITKEWNYAKLSAVELFPAFYPKLTEEHKIVIHNLYMKSLSDEAYNIRKATVISYMKCINFVDKKYVETNGLLVFQKLADDANDTVRSIAINLSIQLMKELNDDLIDEKMSETLSLLAEDLSWRVRVNIADKLYNLQYTAGPRIGRLVLLPILEKLTVDQETIVREKIAFNVPKIYQLFCTTSTLDEEIEEKLIAIIKTLSFDVANVQANLSENLMILTEFLTADKVKALLQPIVLELIQNTKQLSSIDITNVNKLVQVVGYESLQTQLQYILFNLLSNATSNWRSKRELLFTILISSQNTDKELFTQNILPFYHKLLNDPVFAIRRIAPLILPPLIQQYGLQWAKKNILNMIFNLTDHPSYKYRYAVLYAIDVILQIPHIAFNDIDANVLFKISHLSKLLENLFVKDDQFEQLYIYYDPSIKECLDVYAEETLDALVKCSQLEIDHQLFYDLLVFIYRYIYDIIIGLSCDKTDNIKMICAKTLQYFILFKNQLKCELLDDRLQEILMSFSDDERKQVLLDEIESDLNVEECFMKEKRVFLHVGKTFEEKISRRSLDANVEPVNVENRVLYEDDVVPRNDDYDILNDMIHIFDL